MEAKAQYMGITKKLHLSIENLYRGNEDILGDIEEALNTRSKAFPVVGYQGVPGAYGEEAAVSYFGESAARYKNHETFEDIMKALEEGTIDYGVLPIENSSAGEVLDTYDLIKEYSLYIVGEQTIKVEHNLLGIRGSSIEQIKDVYSHPQAISQTQEFLKKHPYMEQQAFVNTAAACRYVAHLNDASKAAIASKRAAKLYNLEILQENIHFNKNNVTRFVVLAKKMNIDEECNKISIIFTTQHVSGSLYNILGHFAYNGLNLLKIQSRPLLEKEWEYYFFADLEGNLQEANVLIALSKIMEHSKYFKILGNYKRAE